MGVLAVVLAIVQSQEKEASKKLAAENQAKLEKAQQELQAKQDDNLRKTEDLVVANEQIAKLQEELRNQITGGNSLPRVLMFASLKQHVEDKDRNVDYYIIYFDLINTGKYPLHNIKCTISDLMRYDMLKKGIMHNRDGAGSGSYDGSAQRELKTYTPTHHFDIGTITTENRYVLYTTTYTPETSIFDYNVEVQ